MHHAAIKHLVHKGGLQLKELHASGIKGLQHQYLAQSGNSYTPIYLINSGLRQFILCVGAVGKGG